MSNGADKLCVQLDSIVEKASNAEYVKEAGQYVRSAAVLGTPAVSGYLRQNIFQDFETGRFTVTSQVYTDVTYAPYVELGTGPKGELNHSGISPEIEPVYKTKPWWIHESQIDIWTAEMYHWPYIDTPEGRFYKCSGQPARPFLYPALKDNESTILDIMKNGMNDILKGGCK